MSFSRQIHFPDLNTARANKVSSRLNSSFVRKLKCSRLPYDRRDSDSLGFFDVEARETSVDERKERLKSRGPALLSASEVRSIDPLRSCPMLRLTFLHFDRWLFSRSFFAITTSSQWRHETLPNDFPLGLVISLKCFQTWGYRLIADQICQPQTTARLQ
jgi:hypothetical protein